MGKLLRLFIIPTYIVITCLFCSPLFEKRNKTPIDKVKILDKNLKVVKVLSTAKELDSFELLWNEKKELSSELPPDLSMFSHKIDVLRGGRSTRWLYSFNGKVTVLTITKSPVYEIRSYKEFNDLIANPGPGGRR